MQRIHLPLIAVIALVTSFGVVLPQAHAQQKYVTIGTGGVTGGITLRVARFAV